VGSEQRQATTPRRQAIASRLAALAFLTVVVALSLAGVGAEPSKAQQATTAIVTGTERVFVRRGPGNEFPPFASIPSGSTVDVQEMRGEWARIITASGQVGYINSRFLSLPGEVEHHAPTPPHPTATRPSPKPTTPRPQFTPTPAAPTNTRGPTRTLPPSPTRTSTHSPAPSRTPSETRTPSVTRTVKATRTPTIAPTVTTTPTWTVTPTSREPVAMRTANQRSRDLEAEIASLKQDLADEKGKHKASGGSDNTAVAPAVDGCSDQVRTELARLAVAVESLQHRTSGISEPSPEISSAVPTPQSTTPTEAHLFPPVAIALGFAGIVIGWGLGSSHARRQERSRRLRLRF